MVESVRHLNCSPPRRIVVSATDLSTLSVDELVKAFVETILFRKTIEHIGRKNRLVDRIGHIERELAARDPKLDCLRGLLQHSDREVRLYTAVAFKDIDRATFKKILTDLAKGKDDVGFEIRMFFDDVLKGKEPRDFSSIDPNPDSAAAKAAWQPRHPPPAAMSLAQIRRRLARTMSPEFAGHVQSLARPAIGLWPQRPRGELSVTASKLGGMPHAPPGWVWPLCQTEPLFFLGQINCAELRGLPAAEKLPSSGLLAFFADHDAFNGCTGDHKDAFAVYHWTDLNQLALAAPPVELQRTLPLCALAFRPMIEVPDSTTRFIEELDWGDDDRFAYTDLREAIYDHGIPERHRGLTSHSKLFGWPAWVQYESEEMAELDRLYGLHLLLQLDAFTDGTTYAEWGGGGSLYFMIRDADLAAGRFDRCEFVMQGT
jgi:uncharacterized protein YwqG